MKAVVLLGAGDQIATWEYQALSLAVDKGLDIIRVAHCMNDRRPSLRAKFSAYSALALAAERRTALRKPTSIRPLLPPGVEEVSFHAEWQGGRQRIPDSAADGFRGADVVIKLGMGSLRAPEALPVVHGVLSYHQGDPEQFRGRPPSYYELEHGADVQSVKVQRLTDTLDGVEVLAKGYARVVPYSYTQTMRGIYLAAVPLLAKAITALEKGEGRRPDSLGAEYRVPTTAAVARQSAALARAKLSRLAWGLFGEQGWQVARLSGSIVPEEHVSLSPARIQPLDVPRGYTFVADPCSAPNGAVYGEALNSRTGLGEIARWSAGEWVFLDLGLDGRHASYPQAVEDGGSLFLFPEIAQVSRPTLYRLEPDGVTVSERLELEGLDGLRLLDATLFKHGETWYLFAGQPGSAESRLDLWTAPSLTGPYRPHPSSPVCLDPRGARMAGPIAEIGGNMYRFGQDCSRHYGGRVTVHRIDVLTEDAYEESVSGLVECSDSGGPHTVSISGNEIWIDFFHKKTTPMAGVRRVRARSSSYLRSRRSRQV